MGRRVRGPVLNSSTLSTMPMETEIPNLSIEDLISNMRIVLVISSLLPVTVLLIPIIMFGMGRAGPVQQISIYPQLDDQAI